MDRARHAFGSLSGVANALENNLIDAYDILFLDGDTDPKVGWIDKNGVFRLVESKNQVVRVDNLPETNGDENVVYVYNNETYIWDGEKCVSTCKPTDVSALESQVTKLGTELESKVDETTVQSMIEKQVESVTEVVEF